MYHVLQIVVGCEAESCDDHHPVLLQYRKDARSVKIYRKLDSPKTIYDYIFVMYDM